ncbi:hypothetical protein H7K05_10300 [Priestia aryabhattai]|uniref:hypothetical protein n=1 Tax=Priestia TaxID=2800373 RepID=UPI00064F3616|nr:MULTISPECIES: hypothetical protein [Priestia]KML30477.1 hypothetical protein VL11_05075 [Priestia aryabhattai]KMN99991.1 hypothetical protein ABV89_08930 [Priestia aryabhattai]MBY0005718.1 hypothetical protein [Priestia aryabhattai]MBY0047601.1 hypothetical protein [Priestia aryabhattai]MDE8673596.1 hypothetical protein [Priestia aryabhattai]
MSGEYQINESKEDIDKLMLTYFNFINGKYLEKALKSFAEREGYGQEIVFAFFQSDLDEYDMEQLPRPLDEKHVLIELGYPAVEIEQIAFLDFKTFYDYLEKNVNKEVENKPEKTELTGLLAEVKRSLCV